MINNARFRGAFSLKKHFFFETYQKKIQLSESNLEESDQSSFLWVSNQIENVYSVECLSEWICWFWKSHAFIRIIALDNFKNDNKWSFFIQVCQLLF